MCDARRVRRLCPRDNGDRCDGDDLCLVGSLAPVGLLCRRDGGGWLVRAHKADEAQVHGGRDRGSHRAQPPGTRRAPLHGCGARAAGRPLVVCAAHGGNHKGRGEGRADGLSEEGVHGEDGKAALHRRRDCGRDTRSPFRRVPRCDASPCDACARPCRRGRQHLRFVSQGDSRRQGLARRDAAYAWACGERGLPVARLRAYALRRQGRGGGAHGPSLRGRRGGAGDIFVLLSARYKELPLSHQLRQCADAGVQGRGRAGAELFREEGRGAPSGVHRSPAGYLHELGVDSRARRVEDHGVRKAVAPRCERCAHASRRRGCPGRGVGRAARLFLRPETRA